MKLIDKIEIKYFRSFSDQKVEISTIRDLNVFSGSNDSGKSNILRALNLFFNNQTSHGLAFDFINDLSKIQLEKSNKRADQKRKENEKEVRQKDLFVEIKIHFSLDREGMLPKKFWVSKRWTSFRILNPYINDNVETRYKKEKGDLTTNQRNALKGQLTQFLGKIEYRYVPAIKDRNFFLHLYRELQQSLTASKTSKIKSQSSKLQTTIRTETSSLFEEFKKSTGLDASFLLLEDNLIDFTRSVEVETAGNVFLTQRGDGVQARFIPDVLNELSKTSTKKFIIWGFEEPENSYEPKNIRKLRNNFIDSYSKDKQIFLTTHDREFLAVHDDENTKKQDLKISIYRVFKKVDSSSQIERYQDDIGFDKEKIQLTFWGDEKRKTKQKKNVLKEVLNDLGVIDYSRRISDLENLVRTGQIKEEELRKALATLSKPCVLVEDENLNLYKIAWLKLNGIIFDVNNFYQTFDDSASFNIYGCGGKEEVRKKIDMPKQDDVAGKKIIGVFDFDEAYLHEFKGLQSSRWGGINGTESDCLYRQRTDHKNIHAIMIPVPAHRIGYASQTQNGNHLIIEHLFVDNDLNEGDHIDTQNPIKIPGNSTLVKIKRKKQVYQTAITLEKKSFDSFRPLFKRINEIICPQT